MTAGSPARTRQVLPQAGLPAARTRLVVHLAAGAAWAGLFVLAVVGGGDGGHVGHAGHAGHGAPAASPPWLLGYGLMVVAMMWPLMAPVAALVARSTFPSRRVLHVGIVLVVTTSLWLAFGAALHAVTLVLGPATPPWWPTVWLGVAVAVTWLPRRARLLWLCLRLPPVYPGGRRGLGTTTRAAWVFWRRCALLCGPVMAAMVTDHGLAVMALASAAVWWEQWHPRARRDHVPRALLAAALLASVVGLP